MTEDSKTKLDTNIATLETQESTQVRKSQHQPKNKAVWIIIALQFIALIALIAAGIYFYLKLTDAINENQNSAQISIENSQKNMSLLKKGLGDLELEVKDISGDKLTELQTELNATLTNFKTFEQNVNAINKRLKELSPRDEQQWMISQIEYFINLAQYRLVLTGDNKGAALLLDQASAVTAQLRSPDAQNLLTALSEDRASLKIEGFWQPELIHAQINALINKIPNLSVEAYSHKDFDTQEETEVLSSKAFQKILSSLVRVQKTDSAVKPLLDDTTRKQVEQHLFMLLTEAQLNVMRQNQVGYESALTQLADLVKEAFDSSRKETQFFIEELQRLQKIEITQPTATLEKSQQALRNLISIFEKKNG